MRGSPYSVTDITTYIENVFASDDILTDVWIDGEVLESYQSRAGHVYFTLGDGGAKLKSVLFRANALRQLTLPRIGDSCSFHGSISVYPREGTYQYYVDFVRPAGIGLAALEFQLLRQRLESEGLFDPSRKRTLPEWPRTIGVVTSTDGAVLQDIRNVLQRRNPFARVLVAAAFVQGDRAPDSLLAALSLLIQSSAPDVIILARGGGSASDLSAFNDEQLVRAVFSSPIPVVSAVGHETDWSLVDEAADLRAPTPSAAAELTSPDVRGLLALMRRDLADGQLGALRAIQSELLSVSRQRDRIELELTATLAEGAEKLGEQNRRITRVAGRVLHSRQEQIHHLRLQLHARGQHVKESRERSLAVLDSVLKALDPMNVLRRGYAAVYDVASGSLVSSVDQTAPGETLAIEFHDGSIESRVEHVQPKT